MFWVERMKNTKRSCCDQGTWIMAQHGWEQNSYREWGEISLNGAVDLKQIGCQIFLQQRWVYSGPAETCSSGSATMVWATCSPCTARDDECFYRGKRKLGGGGYSKRRVHGFSLAESLREEDAYFSSCGALPSTITGSESSSFWSPNPG